MSSTGDEFVWFLCFLAPASELLQDPTPLRPLLTKPTGNHCCALHRIPPPSHVRGVYCLPRHDASDGENSAGSSDVFSQVLESSSENLLADDSERLADALVACGERGGERVDIVVDNAGRFRLRGALSPGVGGWGVV